MTVQQSLCSLKNNSCVLIHIQWIFVRVKQLTKEPDFSLGDDSFRSQQKTRFLRISCNSFLGVEAGDLGNTKGVLFIAIIIPPIGNGRLSGRDKEITRKVYKSRLTLILYPDLPQPKIGRSFPCKTE